MLDGQRADENNDDEPPMFAQRPSSIRSHDITHILVKTFRELFTRDTIAPDTLQNLNTSRFSDDEYHQKYVDALMMVQNEHSQRLAEFDMLERHIMQAQARAVSSDEREAHRLYASIKQSYPDVYVPPVQNHFRSCIDSDFLKKHNLISPDDFSNARIPVVPPPAGPDVPHYAQAPSSRWKSSSNCRTPHSGNQQNDRTVIKRSPQLKRQRSLPKLELLWKQEVSRSDRATLRNDLSKLQSKVDFLKNSHFISPASKCHQAARRTLVDDCKRSLKEIGLKPTAVEQTEPAQIFVATPTVVRFTDYEPGLTYEMSIELMNVSSVMRPIRVVPPQTPYFSVSLGQFPSNTSQVAPGLSCVYHIRFLPDAVCDFDDVLTVETLTAAPLCISLQARRQPPVLTLPECMDVGHCLVGGIKIGRFTVKTTGGSGRFCIMETDSWCNMSFKSVSTQESLRFGAIFEVKPVLFEVTPDQPATLDVVFAPDACGEFSQQLTILCDNCHVRHVTITGKGVKPHVELVSVPESLLSSPSVGELCDAASQYFLRFPPLNPYTYTQRMITIKNFVDVELPYYWILVKPEVRVVNPTEPEQTSDFTTERVLDDDTVFSVDPEAGILPPGSTACFVLTFAPSQAAEYHNALHLVLRYLQHSNPTDKNGDDEQWAVKPLMAPVYESFVDDTVLEIDIKGSCLPFNVTIEPSACLIPGLIPQDTVVKKKFKMYNQSLSTVWFSWGNIASWFVLHMEPSVGGIPAQTEMSFDLSLSATQSGQIDEQLICHFECIPDTLALPVKATVKYSQLVVEEGDLDFGILRLGESKTLTLTVRNVDRIPLEWKINESLERGETGSESEFEFCPSAGFVKPLTAVSVSVTFNPKYCRSFRSILELSVSNGCGNVIAVTAEVQSPQVCLLRSTLNLEAYVDVPVCQTVTLFNQTVFETAFSWGSACGLGSEMIELDIKPQTGRLAPRQQLDITVTLVAHTLGKLTDIFVPCVVDGMTDPVCLLLQASVSNLNVTFSVSRDQNDSDAWLTGDGVTIDFGSDVMIGSVPERYLRIRNNSGISAPFRVNFEHFGSPMTEDGQVVISDEQYTSSKKETAVLAGFTNTDMPSKALTSLCQNMLKRGFGIAFDVKPFCGWLDAFSEITLKITAFSDIWGTYSDQLHCHVGDLESKSFPVTITTVGSPLHFQMVSHNRKLSPILRFGEALDCQNTISRKTRILNTSSFDIRLDWLTFNVAQNDKQLVDLITVYGQPFTSSDVQASVDTSSEKVDQLYLTKPKVLTLKLREHGGFIATEPFTIQPSHFIIPAHGSEFINVNFLPRLPIEAESIPTVVDCMSYGLGYMTLEPSNLMVGHNIQRQHQYNVAPLRLDFTGTIKPAQVDFEWSDDDESHKFLALASDLLTDGVSAFMKPVHLVVHSAVLSNKNSADMTFSASCCPPFSIIQVDQVNPELSSRLNETSTVVLKPHQSALIHIAFCLSSDILTSAEELSEKRINLELTESEKTLHFSQDLQIRYHSHFHQSIPLEATVVIPVLKLSSTSVNFGTCFVGQTRKLEIILSNTSRSGSVWKCFLDSRSEKCKDDTFIIDPCSGFLEGQLSFSSNNRTVLHIHFNPHAADVFDAVFAIDGFLGEERMFINIHGEGTVDGQFEALVSQ